MWDVFSWDFRVAYGVVITSEGFMGLTGLAASVWDPSGGDKPLAVHDSIKYIIRQNGCPTLDVGCKTSIRCLQDLKSGFEVEGVDVSADMLAICREKADWRGLKPILCQ